MVNPAGKCDHHRDRVRWGGGKGRGRWLVVSGTKRPASEAIRTLRMTTQEIALALSAASFGLIMGFFVGYAVRAYISRRRRRRYRG